MSIFSKPLSQLETADLQDLLNDGAVENVRLEFKLLEPSKEEILKKLSSFANTLGGYLVIGARADSADGRIQGLPGVDVLPGYKQKIVQWCFDGASPPLVVEVSDPIPVPDGNGRICYVLHTPESDLAPHFLNGRKGIWVRTDEFSARFGAQLGDENELRHLLERRKLIRERRTYLLDRARKRFDAHGAKKHTDLGGHRTNSGPLLELCVVPRFPARQLCQQESLKDYVLQTRINWRSTGFPVIHGSILSQHESAIVLDAAATNSIFEINVWGMLFYGAELKSDYGETPSIHLYQFVGYVLAFTRHAGEALRAMGYSGPILIDVALDSIREVPWLWNSGLGPFSRPGSELDDEFALSSPTTSDDLSQKSDDIAKDIVRHVLFSANFPELVSTPQKLESLIRTGYEYNGWPVPR
jgi:hypothetical protein